MVVENAEVNPGDPSILSRPELAPGNLAGHFKSQQLNRLSGCRGMNRRSREIKSLEKDNFLQFPGFTVYKSLQVPCLWCEEKYVQRFGG